MSVSGAQIVNNLWVWYSHNIPPMIKMSNSYFTQRWAQDSNLGVMIGRCSLDSKHGRPCRHPANVGCSLFRHTNSDLKNRTNQRLKRKTWTRQDNQLALHYYFKSNPTQRGYRKRMMEIWQELSIFQTTSQRLADQVRTRRTRKLLETTLNSRNLIKGINIWAVPLVRYSGPFLKWTRDELKQMDQRTRKIMTMHKALHPRDDEEKMEEENLPVLKT